MFGRRGLLAKESEDKCENGDYQSKRRKKVSDNAVVQQGTSNEKPSVRETQNPCENVDEYSENVPVFSSSSKEENLSIVIVPLSDLPPMEAAFSIKKIRNAIFSLLEPEDLLQCRLVSQSWLRMASEDKLLKKKIEIQIKHNLKRKDLTCAIVNNQKKRLEDVRDFLESLGTHSLPCSTSMILKMTIADMDCLKFLDLYGFAINSLDLTFQTSDGKIFVYQMNSLLEFVTKLLTEQMPNLETLEMKFQANTKFEGEINPLLLEDITRGLYFAGKHNHSLRTIRIGPSTPFEIIDAVCCVAPKLEELMFNQKVFWEERKHRWNLLKSLDFRPVSHPWDREINLVEAMVDSKENVAFKRLTLNFFFVNNHSEVLSRLGTLLIKMFVKSADSLEKLKLYPVYFLPGTVLPRMSKVKLLSVNSPYFSRAKAGWRWLPEGISIATTFPNLHTIKFAEAVDATSFLSSCQNEEIASVKRVVISPSEVHVSALRKYFPNAVFS